MNTSDEHPLGGVSTVREVGGGTDPGVSHPEWRDRFPWLCQGTTGRGEPEAPLDMSLFNGGSPPGAAMGRWTALRASTGFSRAVHAHQVHGAEVRFHHAGPPGLYLPDPCDGHATADGGVLLTITVADCVPVFVVDPHRRTVALLHAGWRGAAAGVLERGVEVLGERTASRPSDLVVHLGPGICKRCYEVGPVVFEALGLEAPAGPALLDLRGALARRAVAVGVPAEQVSVSELCTRCGEEPFFSHRGGDRFRQVAYLGIVP